MYKIDTQQKLREIQKNNKDTAKQVQSASMEIDKLKRDNADLCSKTESLEEKVLTLELHQRHNILLFSGITE